MEMYSYCNAKLDVDLQHHYLVLNNFLSNFLFECTMNFTLVKARNLLLSKLVSGDA